MNFANILQNPAAAALIGASLTFLGGIMVSIITQYWAVRKEERRWKREDEREQKKLEKEAEENERQKERIRKEQIRDIYHQCIRLLGTIATTRLDIISSDYINLVSQAHDGISMVTLYLEDRNDIDTEEFSRLVQEFTASPNYHARSLRGEVIKIASQDVSLYQHPIQKPKIKSKETILRVSLDKNFRGNVFVQEGKQLNSYYEILYSISKLSPSQRQILWDAYSEGRLPNPISLKLPHWNKGNNQILPFNREWYATFEPVSISVEEIFTRWEIAYTEALTEAQAQQSSS